MIFLKKIIIQPNISIANNTISEIIIKQGIIHLIEISFPAGCKGLVGIAICNTLHQIFPTTPDEWFTDDNVVLSYRENYEIKSDESKLFIRAYNEDEKYVHTIIVKIAIIEKKSWRIWF